jgi:hypothetical protein
MYIERSIDIDTVSVSQPAAPALARVRFNGVVSKWAAGGENPVGTAFALVMFALTGFLVSVAVADALL